MIKRVISLVIIASMILHCSSRLGVLSYLYKQRQKIALAVGIITEAPIALCSHDYYTSSELRIESAASEDHLPLAFSSTQEIILFFTPVKPVFELPEGILMKNFHQISSEGIYSAPSFSIFHPPLA